MNTPQEFAPLLAALRGLPDASAAGAALVTLTRTSGSTFRRAGARMLVHADGRLVRGLSGGCPERDITARACEVIAGGGTRLIRYDRQRNFDVMLEMGCGGELEVLIEPLREPSDWRFAEAIADCLAARESGVLATVFSRDGRCLAAPQRLLLRDARVAHDTLDERALAAAIREQIAALPPRFKPQVLTLAGAEVLLEQLQPPLSALLAGINATSLALARLLATLGWELLLVSHDPAELEGVELPAGARHACRTPQQIADALRFDARSFAVVMTHNLERDVDYLRALRSQPLAYLGAIGARQRVARLFDATGLSPQQLHAPAGLDIGSETPEEIALAIAAEMLAVANGHDGGPLRAHDAPIHR